MEFALIVPLVVMCAMALIGTLSVCLSTLQLNDMARTIVRSAITSDDPTETAQQLAQARNVRVAVTINEQNNLISIEVQRTHTVPLLGRWLPHLRFRGSATMMREPPYVLE